MTIQACLHILKLDSVQDNDQLHRAYRRQVKRWHPDQFAHQPAIHAQAEERLKRINHAYSFLKEHLAKTPPDHPHSTTKKTRAEECRKPPPQPSAKPFHRSKWFTSKNRKSSQKNQRTVPVSGNGANEKPSFARKKPSFEHILREAADIPHCHFSEKRSATRPFFHPHLYKKGKKGLRVEGFRPARPIIPVTPVSKINKIEGSGG